MELALMESLLVPEKEVRQAFQEELAPTTEKKGALRELLRKLREKGIRYEDIPARLEETADKFLKLSAANASLIISDSIKRIGKTDPANVQQIAASQLDLLAAYHQIALAQSRRSFFWALVGSGLGLSFFIAAAAFALTTGNALTAVIPLLSGAVVEVVAGIVFVLYGKTTSQLSSFHSRLEVLQRYL